jgi:hypothetical protein
MRMTVSLAPGVSVPASATTANHSAQPSASIWVDRIGGLGWANTNGSPKDWLSCWAGDCLGIDSRTAPCRPSHCRVLAGNCPARLGSRQGTSTTKLPGQARRSMRRTDAGSPVHQSAAWLGSPRINETASSVSNGASRSAVVVANPDNAKEYPPSAGTATTRSARSASTNRRR